MLHVGLLSVELVIFSERSESHRFSDDNGLSVIHFRGFSFETLANFLRSLSGLNAAFKDFALTFMNTDPHSEVLRIVLGTLGVFAVRDNNGSSSGI